MASRGSHRGGQDCGSCLACLSVACDRSASMRETAPTLRRKEKFRQSKSDGLGGDSRQNRRKSQRFLQVYQSMRLHALVYHWRSSGVHVDNDPALDLAFQNAAPQPRQITQRGGLDHCRYRRRRTQRRNHTQNHAAPAASGCRRCRGCRRAPRPCSASSTTLHTHQK